MLQVRGDGSSAYVQIIGSARATQTTGWSYTVLLTTTTAGTLTVWRARNSGTDALTLEAGSWIRAEKQS